MKYTGYKIKFQDGTESKGYVTKKFCKFFLRDIQSSRDIKGKVIECELSFLGNPVQKEALYQMLKLEEICIRCRNQKPYIVYDLELSKFVFRNPDYSPIAWGKDYSQAKEDSWKNCKSMCRYYHETQTASNAYIVGKVKSYKNGYPGGGE